MKKSVKSRTVLNELLYTKATSEYRRAYCPDIYTVIMGLVINASIFGPLSKGAEEEFLGQAIVVYFWAFKILHQS